eukprot:snap_masked-scaffold_45-processed-gene-1.4-mRNA-1 protein AED:1.00 eAED:1.00 QI:0/0/0/0/1/1/2/0/156
MMLENALPGKNKQQLITQVQRIIHRQSIISYQDIYRVGKVNRSLSDAFIVNKTPYFDERKLLRWCFNVIRFSLNEETLSTLKVPFFRREKDLFIREVLNKLDTIEEFDDFYPHLGSFKQTLSWIWFGYEVNEAVKEDDRQILRWFNKKKRSDRRTF